MQEVYHNIYQILVPLPNNPLKVLNSYVIKGSPRNLIIDTGFNMPESEESLKSGLKALDIDLDKTDIFITHLHADHSGLMDKLKTPANRVWISEMDGQILFFNTLDICWECVMQQQTPMGFPHDHRMNKTDHPGYAHFASQLPELSFFQIGEEFIIGEYRLEVIDLKGHTPGQTGLFDREKGILFSGDHILFNITPNITYWNSGMDDLGNFLENLKKIKDMPVKTLFPAHRQIITNPQERAEQLLEHHDRRLNHILKVLDVKNSTIYEIAAGIPWNFGGGQFLKFPKSQQWFAAGEVRAHMEHLERQNLVRKDVNADSALVYEKVR